MAIENNIDNTASSTIYLDSLVKANPVGAVSQVKEIDNHLRGIKNVLLNTFTAIAGAITATHTELNKLAGFTGSAALLNAVTTDIDVTLNAQFLAKVFPIGCIYLSTTSTNPGTTIGGTWAALAEGQMLLTQGATYTPGSTGGSKDAVVVSHTHTDTFALSTDGAHTHVISPVVDTAAGGSSGFVYNVSSTGQATANKATQSDGSHTHTLSGAVTTAGVSGTNANLPPYLAVYTWQRTA